MSKTEAVMDSDFLQSILLDVDGSEELFKQIMDDLGIIPIVHPYVAEVELQYCKKAQKLINEGYIVRIKYDDFLHSEEERKVYNMQVWDILDEFCEKDLPPEKYQDVFREGFRLTEHSIGEILSELMAKEMRVPLFASNDKGAKSIAKRHFNSNRYQLEVKNLAELLREVISRDTKIKWKEVKFLLKDERWRKDRENLRELWQK